jgi:hypothetical protein
MPKYIFFDSKSIFSQEKKIERISFERYMTDEREKLRESVVEYAVDTIEKAHNFVFALYLATTRGVPPIGTSQFYNLMVDAVQFILSQDIEPSDGRNYSNTRMGKYFKDSVGKDIFCCFVFILMGMVMRAAEFVTWVDVEYRVGGTATNLFR